MDESISVLGKAKKSDVCLEPFPHIIVQDALPEDVYAELEANFPPEGMLGVELGSNNKR